MPHEPPSRELRAQFDDIDVDASDRRIAEWSRYVSTQIAGALVNLAIYAAAIALVSVRPPYPLLRLMCNKCAWFTLLNLCTATLLTLSTSTF